jgi:hypothetical protein
VPRARAAVCRFCSNAFIMAACALGRYNGQIIVLQNICIIFILRQRSDARSSFLTFVISAPCLPVAEDCTHLTKRVQAEEVLVKLAAVQTCKHNA